MDGSEQIFLYPWLFCIWMGDDGDFHNRRFGTIVIFLTIIYSMCMKQLHFSISINAPKEKVWEAVIGKETYPMWTEPFFPGSNIEGSWNRGAKIRFVAPNEFGNADGMISEIAENRLYEYISIHHLGFIKNGVEDTTSEEVRKWTPSFENYTFKDVGGATDFIVNIDVPEEMEDMFTSMWNVALVRLKEVSETGTSHIISVIAYVKAPIESVWNCYNEPKHVTQWAFASDDWEAPSATCDLRVGGSFTTVMASKDGKNKFDFKGTYTKLDIHKQIDYVMEDGRKVSVTFTPREQSIQVIVTFDMEHENTRDLQRSGWQAILNNFKKHVEAEKSS